MSSSAGFRRVAMFAIAFTHVLSIHLVCGQGIVIPQQEAPSGTPQYTAFQKQVLTEKAKALALIDSLKGQNIPDATDRCYQLLEVDRKVFGEKSLQAADTLEVLSLLLWSASDFENAVIAKREIAGIYGAVFGKDDWRTGEANWMAYDWKVSSASPEMTWKRADATALKAKAAALNDAGRHAEALAAAEKANADLKAIFKEDPDVPIRASVLGDMARANYGLNQFSESERLHDEAARIYTSWYGEANPSTVKLLTWRAQASFDAFQKERLYRRVIELCAKMKSYDHSIQVVPLQELAMVYLNSGRHALAEQTMDEAIQVESEVYGPESPSVKYAQILAASIDNRLGKAAEAESELKKLTAYFDAAPADQIVRRIRAHDDLGLVYLDQKKYDEAEKEFGTALSLVEKRSGQKGVDYCLQLSRIGATHFRAKQFDEAAAAFDKCVATSKLIYPSSNPKLIQYVVDLSQSLRMLANDFNEQGQRAEAKAKLQHAADVAVPILGDDHPEAIRVHTALAVQTQIEKSPPDVAKVILDAENEAALSDAALTDQNLAEAEQHFRRAIELRESLGAEQLTYVKATSQFQLGELLRSQEKWAESLESLASSQAAYDAVYANKRPSIEYGDVYFRAGDSALRLRDYPTAIKNFKRSIEIYGDLEGSDANYAVEALRLVADCHRRSADYANALTEFRRYAEEVKRIYGAKSIPYAGALSYLGTTEWNRDDNIAAREYFSRAIELRKSLGEAASGDNIDDIWWLARCETALSHFDAAAALYESVLAHYRAAGDQANLASVLESAAMVHARMANFAEAEKQAQEYLALVEQLYGKESPKMLAAGHVMDYVAARRIRDLKATAKIDEAIIVQEAAIAESAKRLGAESSQLAMSRAELAELKNVAQLSAGKQKTYADALATMGKITGQSPAERPADSNQQMTRVVEQLRDVLGDHSLSVALALEWAADQSKDVRRNESLLREALAIYQELLGKDSVKVADLHAQLGICLATLGRQQAGIDELKQGLESYRNIEVAADNIWPVTAELHLANAYLNLGDVIEAEQCLAEAERKLANRPSFDGSLDLLHVRGILAAYMGNFQEELRCLQSEYDQRVARYGKGMPRTLSVQMSVGDALLHVRDYGSAKTNFEEVKRILEQQGRTTTDDYADALRGLGRALHYEGDLLEAAKLLAQARDIALAERGETSQGYRLALADLADVHFDSNNLPEAEQFMREVLEIDAQLGETQTRIHQTGLIQLAKILVRQNKYEEVADLTEKALKNHERVISSSKIYQTESEQAAAMQEARQYLGWFLYAAQKVPGRLDEAYDHVLWLKGSIFARQRRLRQLRDDPAAADLLSQWSRVTSDLSTLAMRPPYADEEAVWSQRLAALVADKDAIERDLLGMSRENIAPVATTAAVRKALPENSALVDFFLHEAQGVDSDGKKSVTKDIRVFIVRPDREQVIQVIIPNIDKLAQSIDAWRTALDWYNTEEFAKAKAEDDFTTLEILHAQATLAQFESSTAIRDQIWTPLASHLEGVELVIVSPDGPLTKFPLAALPGESSEHEFLIQDRVIASVAVPSLLPELMTDDEAAEAESLLLMGDVNYGGTAGKARWREAEAKSDLRGWLRFFFSPLEGVRPEMEDIKGFFAKAFPDGQEDMFIESEASESVFRKEAPQHRWVHLATHGFYEPEMGAEIENVRDDKGASTNSFVADYTAVLNHEGLKSGLALAGANEANREGEDDGILSAMEVSTMDLSDVELTMLSACQTGLGNSVSGEGVAGLQRALQVAGVGSTVTTLWSVDDTAARLLAARFYHNIWENKMNKAAAIQEAQNWMIGAAMKDDGTTEIPDELTIESEVLPSRFGNPDCWAPFVLSGDWR